MGKRITELDTEEFGRLFTSFEHTAYRLETLQRYDVAYERESFAAFLAGHPVSRESKSEWVGVITDAVQAGKTMRRVHVVTEWPDLPRRDYWLFDSRDLWAMEYDDDGRFLHAEQVDDAAEVVRSNYWRDKALSLAMPYPDYMRSRPGAGEAPPASRASS